MPKIKTRQAIAKRFLVKKSKKGTKILKRHDGQDHFNARQNGKQRRRKRTDNQVSMVDKKPILRGIPYQQ